MKIVFNEDSIKIPPCPKKEKPVNYKDKIIQKSCDDGMILDFYILTSKSSAMAFIYDTLRNYGFPMAQAQYILNDYLQDSEMYQEDMLNWEDKLYQCLNGEEVMTFCYFTNNSYGVIEDGLEDAIKVFNNAKNIKSLLLSDGFDDIMYNGFIVYEDGLWRSYLDLPDDMNFQDYAWENINGTFVQKV